MSKWIDADWLNNEMGDTNMDIYTDEVKDYIANAPSIDIVRCKECKHRASGRMGKMCYGRQPDDFCSYGQRAEQTFYKEWRESEGADDE